MGLMIVREGVEGGRPMGNGGNKERWLATTRPCIARKGIHAGVSTAGNGRKKFSRRRFVVHSSVCLICVSGERSKAKRALVCPYSQGIVNVGAASCRYLHRHTEVLRERKMWFGP